MRLLYITRISILLFIIYSVGSCGFTEIDPDDYGIFSMQNDTTVVMDGLIDSDISTYWDNYIQAFPNTTYMIMMDCPGSTDDEANWDASKNIHAAGIHIHLPSHAVIASGAVDLFLSGRKRTREAGSQLGVHSWSDGAGNEATDYPVGHEEHQGAIDYYQAIGFSLSDAEAFYYFTINAASAEDIHWMTDDEISFYKILK